MSQVQVVSAKGRVVNALSVLTVAPAAGSWLGSAGSVAATVLGPELAQWAMTVGIGTVMMVTGSAVREKLERDLALEPAAPGAPITWRMTFKKIALGLLARVG